MQEIIGENTFFFWYKYTQGCSRNIKRYQIFTSMFERFILIQKHAVSY